jgi:putative flippase GtrA
MPRFSGDAALGWQRQAWRFALIGTLGFLIDGGLLTWMVSCMDRGLIESRLISFALAVSATWYLNRIFTFSNPQGAGAGKEYGRYLGVQVAGALINLGVFAALIAAFSMLSNYPIIPLAFGSGMAMIFNFLGARHYAFHRT